MGCKQLCACVKNIPTDANRRRGYAAAIAVEINEGAQPWIFGFENYVLSSQKLK